MHYHADWWSWSDQNTSLDRDTSETRRGTFWIHGTNRSVPVFGETDRTKNTPTLSPALTLLVDVGRDEDKNNNCIYLHNNFYVEVKCSDVRHIQCACVQGNRLPITCIDPDVQSQTLDNSSYLYQINILCEVPSIVHSKKTDPWGVFDFFQMLWQIFQFSLFQGLKAAFVVLTFQFQVCSALGKPLSLYRAKISGFAFSPTSKRSLQVCVVHMPNLPAARKSQLPMTLHCNWTGAMQRGRGWYKRKFVRIPNYFLAVVDREGWCFWNQ